MNWVAIIVIDAMALALFAGVAAALFVPLGLLVARLATRRMPLVQIGEKRRVRRVALLTSIALSVLAAPAIWVGLVVLTGDG